MILPGSFAASLVLLALGMLCLGSWPTTFKKNAGKWRFELYYFDFAIGAMFAAVVIALTLGTLGFDGFSFTDDVLLAGKRHNFFALVAGIIFNLGNMLLMASISMSGMAVAFPACLGTAMLVDGICRFVLNPGGNVALLVVGMAVTLGAVALDVAVFRMHGLEKLLDLAREGKTKSTRKTVSLKPIALSVTAGLLLGSLNPVINLARAGENGLGPYSLGFVFAAGVLFSTLVFNLFFINLPVEGEPADMIVYFRAQMSLHGVGLLGGIIWYGGAVATLVAARAEGAAYVMPALSYAITSAAVLVGTLWGIAVWKELESTNPAVKTWLGLVLILLAAGIAAFSANISFAA